MPDLVQALCKVQNSKHSDPQMDGQPATPPHKYKVIKRFRKHPESN